MVLSNDIRKSIVFGLILGAILSICNLCFAFEEENVDINVASNLSFSVDNPVITTSTASIGYISIEPGYIYTFTTGASAGRRIGFSDYAPSVGVTVNDISIISRSDSFSFTSDDYNYAYFNYYNYIEGADTITRVRMGGLSSFVDSISYYLSVDNLSTVWLLVVPILGISVLFGLGFYLVKRIMNKIKRAKGGV